MKTLILGLGNPILGDDAAGVLAARLLKERLAGRPGVEVDEEYHGGLRLMERLAGYDRAILIDAVRTGAHPPGALLRLGPDDLPTQHTASAHDVNLPTALRLAAEMKLGAPRDIAIFAVEAEQVLEFDEEPTPAVAAALPRVVEAVLAELAQGGRMISPELLRRYSFFAGFSDQELKGLAMAGREHDVSKGQLLFAEGDPADALHFLIEGEVEILIFADEKGLESVPLSTVPAGELVGWSALMEPHTYTASARATRPTSEIVFNRADVEALAADPHFCSLMLRKVAQVISRRLKDTRIQLLSLTARPA